MCEPSNDVSTIVLSHVTTYWHVVYTCYLFFVAFFAVFIYLYVFLATTSWCYINRVFSLLRHSVVQAASTDRVVKVKGVIRKPILYKVKR